MAPRRPAVLLLGAVLATTLSACGPTAEEQAVASASLDRAGQATIEGDDLVVALDSGPLRITPAEDTEFFICDGDDCATVDEETFRAAVTPGATIRVLGPNADLLTPDATELPPAVWVVLQRDG